MGKVLSELSSGRCSRFTEGGSLSIKQRPSQKFNIVAVPTMDTNKIACILQAKPIDSAEPAIPLPSTRLLTDRHLSADTPTGNDPDRPVESVRLPEPILLQ